MSEPTASARQPARGDLEQLMARYQMADAAATGALIHAVSPLLFRYFLHHCGDREDAADLLQETWLRIHRARHTYRSADPVLPWFYGIARHVQIDGFRRRQRIRSREQTMETLPEISALPVAGPADNPSFESIVAVLPESQREVVTMLKVTGMSLEEVARATASSVGAVKQKAHRAYQTLRQTLRARGVVGNGTHHEL